MALPNEDNEGGEQQVNFMEARDPSELIMMLILAAAYLGLAKYLWVALLTVANWKLLVNVEGFLLIVSLIAIMIGLRPYITPSSLQISSKGLKYKGPYWPQRKTVNWDQIKGMYVSPELVIVQYQPKPDSKRIWLLLIMSLYFTDRMRIPAMIYKYSPVQPVVMTSPHVISRIALGLIFAGVVLWLIEMLFG